MAALMVLMLQELEVMVLLVEALPFHSIQVVLEQLDKEMLVDLTEPLTMELLAVAQAQLEVLEIQLTTEQMVVQGHCGLIKCFMQVVVLEEVTAMFLELVELVVEEMPQTL
jgi:hypothetical protein